MTEPYPNTLIFVDLPTDDTEATADFYHEVFGWTMNARPAGSFYQVAPGQNFRLPDGTQSPVGNLHLGITHVANRRPHPTAGGLEPRHLSRDGHGVRVWILVSDDDDMDAISDRAVARGATDLWRHHFFAEFNGFNNAFMDPWGNTIVLWTKGGDDPQVPEGWTQE